MTGQLNVSCGPTGYLSALKVPGAPESSPAKEGPGSHLGFVGGDGILSTESKYFKNDQLLVKPCEFLVPFFIPLFLDEVSRHPQAGTVGCPSPQSWLLNAPFQHRTRFIVIVCFFIFFHCLEQLWALHKYLLTKTIINFFSFFLNSGK